MTVPFESSFYFCGQRVSSAFVIRCWCYLRFLRLNAGSRPYAGTNIMKVDGEKSNLNLRYVGISVYHL